jgi:hypothetical protein
MHEPMGVTVDECSDFIDMAVAVVELNSKPGRHFRSLDEFLEHEVLGSLDIDLQEWIRRARGSHVVENLL